MTKFFARLALAATVASGSLVAQTALPPVTNDTVDRRTYAEIEKQAAELLKMSFRSFRYYAKKYDLIPRDSKQEDVVEVD